MKRKKTSLWAGRAQRILLGLTILVLLTLVIISEFEVKSSNFRLDQPAPRNIKARKEITTLLLPEKHQGADFRENLKDFLLWTDRTSDMRSQDGKPLTENQKIRSLRQHSSFNLSDEALKIALDLSVETRAGLNAFLVRTISPYISEGLARGELLTLGRSFNELVGRYEGTESERLLAQELLVENLMRYIPEQKTYFRDQMIVREGDIVTSDILRVLKQSDALDTRPRTSVKVLGVTMFVFVAMLTLLLYLYQFNKLIYESVGQLTLIGLIILVILILAKVIILLTRADIEFRNTPLFSPFLIPISSAGLLVAVLMDSKIAISINIIVSILATVMLDNGLTFLMVMLISGTMGVYSVSRASKRADFVRAGMHISFTNVALIFALYLMKPDAAAIFGSRIFIRDILWGFLNGIFSSILVVGALPFIEVFFRTTTAISLQELADLNHPVMQRLLQEAPGTYHHSVNVGNLGEAAAEKIGADPLLCRVGGYYHDIGKLKRPSFFIENQLSGENAHDHLSPHLSSLIITSHIRDGMELAKEYKLTNVIADIIGEHHGTTRISYFYNRALQEAKDDGKEEIKEYQFRYSGPKPRSKEAAIVMLADAIESASRTLVKPTPASIKGLIKKISNDKSNDGQFDESNLTLKDIEMIEDAFCKILMGMFHTRINYPDNDKNERHDRAEKMDRVERNSDNGKKIDEVLS
jgi:hypothetical protein